ncbi:D-aminoacylase [Paenibacillus sp. 32O-W]|uniref:N-acyl-D-amino-acid deacylase family protein n=1 Tax=Paenibacillus sp. 32O-W TaxID=1695218 RepID=UPI000721D02B|nr:D-aminoacylase [Paenibacillus sp. 32O-W]ALS27684.1 D-aminoacylase [Paenibacillus sp. 32O-W]
MLDLLIKNGRVVDGTGNPWYFGDVGIKDGLIAATGRLDQESREVIDAEGKVIAPGFIDGHCHSDLLILDQPFSEVKMQQGVTTEVVGNCGLAPAPYLQKTREQLKSYVASVIGTTEWEWQWETVGEYIDVLSKSRPSENVATYVAHGALKISVMGFENRPATESELQEMKALLEEGMRAGALGLSIGLLYAPGSYTKREELAELCKVVAKYNGLLATHIRGEGNNLLSSVKEVIWIAEQSGVSLHVSHLKAAGAANWGKIEDAIGLIEDARSRGMDVTCDVYPYNAGSTMMTTILPPWALEGGIPAVLERLEDRSVRERIKRELRREQEDWDNLIHSTGWQSVYISAARTAEGRALEGKHMLEISEMMGKDPEDAMMELLIRERGNLSIVYFHMSEADVRKVIAYDKSLIASDSLGCVTGKPHPRSYGTFPRVFAKYVREEKLLTLEQAVRKVSSFPASRFKLGKRGLLVPGYAADLVVFDPDTIRDTATYQEPIRFPDGISCTIVNGKVTVSGKRHTQERVGSFIPAQHHCVHDGCSRLT